MFKRILIDFDLEVNVLAQEIALMKKPYVIVSCFIYFVQVFDYLLK